MWWFLNNLFRDLFLQHLSQKCRVLSNGFISTCILTDLFVSCSNRRYEKKLVKMKLQNRFLTNQSVPNYEHTNGKMNYTNVPKKVISGDHFVFNFS